MLLVKYENILQLNLQQLLERDIEKKKEKRKGEGGERVKGFVHKYIFFKERIPTNKKYQERQELV